MGLKHWILGGWFVFCCLLAPGLDTQQTLVTVHPKESNAILANPGMGWQTFHRTRKEDRNLPGWIPSTVHYARWGWGTLEPVDGEIDHKFLERVLEETREAGQRLAFRVMCCSTTPRRPYHPSWLEGAGGKILECRRRNGPLVRVPDLDDTVVLAKHLDFISRLGKRYDGHPDIDHIDLGSVGWWGEWHMSGSDCNMPTPANRKAIVSAYLGAFKKTPLLMLIGGGECLVYATRNRSGWRADCLGDMGGFSKTWCHMRMAYPKHVKECEIEDVWKEAPVAWETCWDMRKWVDEGWPIRFIFNYALVLHGSYINNKSAPLPPGEDVRAELERFLRRLGYRLELKELKHASRARAGQELQLNMQWRNTGSAPCYRPYRLAYRFDKGRGSERVVVSKITVNRWLPGSVELFTEEFFKEPGDLPPGEVVKVDDSVTLPRDMPPGDYALSVGVVGEKSSKPMVQLGIEGRDAAGWYPVSKVRVLPGPPEK